MDASFIVASEDVNNQDKGQLEVRSVASRYYHSSKKVDLRSSPRTWRTRKDHVTKILGTK